jgi:hypothetical protein
MKSDTSWNSPIYHYCGSPVLDLPPNGLRSRTSPADCGAGVDVDSVLGRTRNGSKPRAHEMLENRARREAQSPASSAGFVRRFFKYFYQIPGIR